MVFLDESEISSLSSGQEKALSLIACISATISIFGSGLLLNLIFRAKNRTPYRRLLGFMSVWDIIFSIQVSLQGFLLPQETSQNVWAFGNDKSCSALGFFNQLSFATFFYNGALSYYYVLTIKGGMSEERFSNRVEPWFHVVCNGYPLITAVVGAGIGVYGESELGTGCWVNNWPENCGTDPTETGEECKSVLIAWIFAGLPIILLLLLVAVNNIVIYVHVRNTTRKSQRHSTYQSTRSLVQERRLQTVASQAFLYVGGFLLTQVWIMALKIVEGASLVQGKDLDRIFPVLILTVFFVPLQGLFNLLIYIRPIYFRVKDQYPSESSSWHIQRSLFGGKIQPSNSRSQLSVSKSGISSDLGDPSGLFTLPRSEKENRDSESKTAQRPSVLSHLAEDDQAGYPTILEATTREKNVANSSAEGINSSSEEQITPESFVFEHHPDD